MRIVTDSISTAELATMAAGKLGDLVKAVVDVERELLAVDAGLHADLESLLLDNGSRQSDLWGINLYPGLSGEDMIEYDSMINVRPQHGNRSRGVDNPEIRELVVQIVLRRVTP
jgi:hypothetical protein